ncbi:MAG: GNAT family N-acetyltransferase [SAR86 cluster bacterium]|uniref:GNAT family N-acetyltransferase n=1 Tax=SAR86 cluster bacterium TaxID=2030880 RepID=A0A2A5AL03_9GAMM|nr:MAG: GNAT family N-acetyltransferase [SAR86 cluster bacterium]
MDYYIKSATETDIDFLLSLRISTMEVYLAEMGIPIDQEFHLDRIRYKFESARIIVVDSQRIGLLKYFANEENYELIQMQISPQWQNRGYGAKLIEVVLKEARKADKPVILSVLKSNPAKGLYTRLGFCVIAETEQEFKMKLEPNNQPNNQ